VNKTKQNNLEGQQMWALEPFLQHLLPYWEEVKNESKEDSTNNLKEFVEFIDKKYSK